MKETTKRKILQSAFSRKVFHKLQSLWYKPGEFRDESLLRVFQRDGIVILPGFFSKESCDKAIGTIEETIVSARQKTLDKKIKTIDNGQVYYQGERLIFSFDFKHVESYINEMVHNPELLAICGYLNQSKLKVIQHWTKRVYARVNNSKTPLMNEQWHQDSGGLSMIRFIVYLDDISEAQGPFEYIKGSQTQEIRNVFGYADAHPEKIIRVQGQKGDVVIADVTGGWHKANAVIEGHRDTLQVACMSPLSDKINRVFGFGSYLKTQ